MDPNVNVEQLKKQAKKLKRETGTSHVDCLNELAAGHGYQNWAHLMSQVAKRNKSEG